MKKQIIYPNFIPRVFASTLDLFLLSIIATPITTFISFQLSTFLFKVNIAEITIKTIGGQEFAHDITASKVLLYIILISIMNFIIMGSYFIIFWIYYSATPGKMIMHMKIVDAETLGKASKWQLVKRFCGYISILFGVWFIVFSKQRQALHDKIAGTTVIKS